MKYGSGQYTQSQLRNKIHQVEMSLSQRFDAGGVITDMAEQRSWRERIEEASLGRNTVIYDDKGNPSIMVRVPLETIDGLITGGSLTPHPAFIVNGVTKPYLFVSKYQNTVVGTGVDARAVSLKYRDPKASTNFDQAKVYCESKGPGWHLMTNAEWAAIALRCRKRGFMPRGNNSYGKDYAITSEKGIPSYIESGKTARVLTGSGPAAWSDDGTPFGIYDLNGNVYEWMGGYRTVDGEIQIIPNNDAAAQIDQTATSALWKAILEDGSLVAPGTADTLKWDYTNPVPAGGTSSYGFGLNKALSNQADNDSAYGAQAFQSLTAAAGVTVPELLKSLAIMPADSGDHGGDYFYMRNRGERLGARGGNWSSASNAGVFYMYGVARSNSNTLVGFRSAFVL